MNNIHTVQYWYIPPVKYPNKMLYSIGITPVKYLNEIAICQKKKLFSGLRFQ